MIQMNLQLFKGGTTVNNTTSYTPSEYELALQKTQSNYANAVSPNALWLNDTAKNLLSDSLGTVKVDYNNLNNTAQNQIASANSGITNLTNGVLPTAYTDSMKSAIQSTLDNTIGSTMNDLSNRGVLNSSVTSTAMNDITKDAADTTAKNYTNNISSLGTLYNNQISNVNAATTAAAANQEAAIEPATTLWNASLGLNNSGTSALSAASGKGTTTSTQTTSGGGLLSGLMGGLV